MKTRPTAVAFALACLAASCTPAPTSPPTLPNIVMVVIDDLGWADLASFGNRVHQTPNADRLAREGVRFTRAYANGPNCSPARASLLTGQYPPRHGIYDVYSLVRPPVGTQKLAPGTGRYYLPLAAITIAEALQARGYRTASIGKWHLGTGSRLAPERQGFDVAIGSGGGAGQPRSHVSPYRMSGLVDGPAGELLSDRLSDEAVRFIDANHGRPFFLLLSHYAVHEPLQAEPGGEARYLERVGGNPERARYAAMIEATDRGLGRVLDALDRHGLAEDTVVILTSDNGGNRAWASLGRLRGSKNTFYEGGLRVPMIVRWPRTAPAGRVLDAPVIGIDLYPTLLEVAHAARAEGQTLDGVSLVPLLKGGELPPPRPLFWHFPDYLWSDRLERFRMKPSSAVLLGDEKLIERFETGGAELYDLAHDPSERDDVSAQRPDKVRELRDLLAAWRTSTGAALPHPR